MSEHKASIVWARNGADFGYKNYPRDHVWRFPNGVEVPGSAAPAYLGNPQRVDPEAAFVAALWPAESAVRGSLVEALEYE